MLLQKQNRRSIIGSVIYPPPGCKPIKTHTTKFRLLRPRSEGSVIARNSLQGFTAQNIHSITPNPLDFAIGYGFRFKTFSSYPLTPTPMCGSISMLDVLAPHPPSNSLRWSVTFRLLPKVKPLFLKINGVAAPSVNMGRHLVAQRTSGAL